MWNYVPIADETIFRPSTWRAPFTYALWGEMSVNYTQILHGCGLLCSRSDTKPAARTALPLVHTSRISPSGNSKDFHVGQEIAPGPAPLARAHYLPSGGTGSRHRRVNSWQTLALPRYASAHADQCPPVTSTELYIDPTTFFDPSPTSIMLIIYANWNLLLTPDFKTRKDVNLKKMWGAKK